MSAPFAPLSLFCPHISTFLRQFLRKARLTVRTDRIGPKAAASLHYYRRTEPGFDGLAGTNLRFSEQGGP